MPSLADKPISWPSVFVDRDPICTGPNFAWSRAIRKDDGRRILVKTAADGVDLDWANQKLRHQFELLREIDHPLVLKRLELLQENKCVYVVCEDFRGEILQQSIPQDGFPVAVFLDIAIQLAGGIEWLHGEGIRFPGLNDGSILLDPVSASIRFFDFSGANLDEGDGVHGAMRTIRGRNAVFFSPELTGRIQHPVNQRSDLFSLGVILYALRTGHLPYDVDDPLKRWHQQAQEVAAGVLNLKQGPEMIARIIGKLLQRDPAARYADAGLLLQDLGRCRQDYSLHGDISAFLPGGSSPSLCIPDTCYGREKETTVFLEQLDCVSRGAKATILISGPAGVGKTRFYRHVKQWLPSHCMRAEGKFEQFQAVPYAAFRQAFAALVQHILSLPEADLAVWKERLSAALADRGTLLVEMIPGLTFLLPESVDVPLFPGDEGKIQFQKAVLQLIRTLGRDGSPLVLFLDDLQWADRDSLELIRFIVDQDDPPHFMMVAAYRPQEWKCDDFQAEFHEYEMRRESAIIHLPIHSIGREDLRSLVADTLGGTEKWLETAVDLLYENTHGNPFMARLILGRDYEKGVLFYREGWQWDLERAYPEWSHDRVLSLIHI